MADGNTSLQELYRLMERDGITEQDMRRAAEYLGRLDGWEPLADLSDQAARYYAAAPQWNVFVRYARESAEYVGAGGPMVADGRAWHRDYLARGRERLDDPRAVAYIESRGFTLDQARSWGWGFDPDAMGMCAETPDGQTVWSSRGRILIPFGGCDWYHADRAISHDQVPEGCKKWGMKYAYPTAAPKDAKDKKSDYGRNPVGSRPMWLPSQGAEVVYVTEGPLDAYAILATGRHAVALGGASNAGNWGRSLADALDARTQALPAGKSAQAPVVVVTLDADNAGRENAQKLADVLDQAGVEHVDANPAETGHKDAAECLAADPAALRAWAGQVESDIRARAWRNSMDALGLSTVTDVALGIAAGGAMTPIPTGFVELDRILGGGLVPGLVTITAGSSMGKTTFLTQAAEQVAKAGTSVLFVTVEQSSAELMAKGIARAIRRTGDAEAAAGRVVGYPIITAHDILAADTRRAWQDADDIRERLVETAAREYARIYADTLTYWQPDGQPTAADIARRARVMARHYGRPPVVCVDYLQILGSADPSTDYRKATDQNTTALRQLARELNTPVVVISSMSRGQYNNPVAMESSKESGLIEYSSDLLLGIQPRHMDDVELKDSDQAAKAAGKRKVNETKATARREVEVKVLKQRMGPVGVTVPYVYQADADLFMEDAQAARTRKKPVKVI